MIILSFQYFPSHEGILVALAIFVHHLKFQYFPSHEGILKNADERKAVTEFQYFPSHEGIPIGEKAFNLTIYFNTSPLTRGFIL